MNQVTMRLLFAGTFSLVGLGVAALLEAIGAGTPEWLPPMITLALGYGLGHVQANGVAGKH
jgi:integral membrane sensor domain MASE1